jgi:hypothetical protein
MSNLVLFEKYINPLKHFDEQRNDGFGHKLSTIFDEQLGIYEVPREAYLDSRFNFWVMHLAFKLTEEYVEIINHAHGIETLCIQTPYRCRIAIAKIFEEDDVKKSLEDKLVTAFRKNQEKIVKKNFNKKLTVAQEALNKISKCWAVLENEKGGPNHVVTGNSQEGLEKSISDFLDLNKGYKIIEKHCG